MKSVTIIGAVLAASQCMPEPSGPVNSAEVGATNQAAPDAGAAEDGGPSTDASVNVEEALQRLRPGPPPFTVPTQRITWPQQRATLLVPQGARLEGARDGADVMLGEGHNFAFRVAPTGGHIEVRPADDAEGVTYAERDDGMYMWFYEGHWFFHGTFAGFDCWNGWDKATHSREEVEMMIASCKSIEQDTTQ